MFPRAKNAVTQHYISEDKEEEEDTQHITFIPGCFLELKLKHAVTQHCISKEEEEEEEEGHL